MVRQPCARTGGFPAAQVGRADPAHPPLFRGDADEAGAAARTLQQAGQGIALCRPRFSHTLRLLPVLAADNGRVVITDIVLVHLALVAHLPACVRDEGLLQQAVARVALVAEDTPKVLPAPGLADVTGDFFFIEHTGDIVGGLPGQVQPVYPPDDLRLLRVSLYTAVLALPEPVQALDGV